MKHQYEIARVSFMDCGEYWSADYVVEGQRTPLMIHKSMRERYPFDSEEFWAAVERSAIGAYESWRDHPEWRVN